jgi:glycosyltransferase 2 family protein
VKGQRGRLLAGAVLAALLLALFFRGVDWSALGQALRGARPLPLAGLVLVTVAIYAARAWRWGDLLAPLGRVGYADLFSATMVGFASGLLVPRAGELLRPWLISRRHPIPTSAGFATIILERLVDLITVLALFALYLFVLPVPAAQREGPVVFARWGLRLSSMDLVKLGGGVFFVGAVCLLGFLAALHANPSRVIGWLERLLAHAPRWLAEPLGRILHAFSGGLAVLRAPVPHLAKVGLQSLAIWLLIALGFHLNHLAFRIDLPFHATFLLIAFLVVGVAIPTPGMVGGFHAFYLLALSEVYGIDRATAAAAGIAAHALTNLPILVFGLALLGREGLSLGRVAQVTRDEQNLQEVRP